MTLNSSALANLDEEKVVLIISERYQCSFLIVRNQPRRGSGDKILIMKCVTRGSNIFLQHNSLQAERNGNNGGGLHNVGTPIYTPYSFPFA